MINKTKGIFVYSISTYFPSHPPTAHTLPSERRAIPPLPACFILCFENRSSPSSSPWVASVNPLISSHGCIERSQTACNIQQCGLQTLLEQMNGPKKPPSTSLSRYEHLSMQSVHWEAYQIQHAVLSSTDIPIQSLQLSCPSQQHTDEALLLHSHMCTVDVVCPTCETSAVPSEFL